MELQKNDGKVNTQNQNATGKAPENATSQPLQRAEVEAGKRGRPSANAGEPKTDEQLALEAKLRVELLMSNDFEKVFNTKIANVFFEAIDKNSTVFETMFNKPWNEMTQSQKSRAKSNLRDGYMSQIYEPLMRLKYSNTVETFMQFIAENKDAVSKILGVNTQEK